MTRTPLTRTFLAVATLIVIGASAVHAAAPTIMRTPDRGIQPQAVIDAKGTIHLIYFKGDPGNGDIFYAKQAAGEQRFSAPIRVNSEPGSAIATGTIRGPQLALGKNNRVHVAWNGSGKASQKSFNKSAPMLYARLNDAGTAFDAQRNLMQDSYNLDGGGAVAADEAGNVYVAWHGLRVGAVAGEGNRQVFVTHSTDEGGTFPKESVANAQPTGTCGCCGMKGFVDSKGSLYLLYRSATANVNRDIYLLTSKDQGKSFLGTLMQKWQINGCPMTSEVFAETTQGMLAAWVTEKQVYFGRVGSPQARPISAPGSANERNHPALAGNAQGETLLVWTEGTGWQKGGSLAWCIFDKDGKPTRQSGRVDGGIPVWGLPTAVAKPDGSFVIIH
ncbi:hypothetical protein AYO44_03515 [Planctomycetaceae bacterium SCGC AG-212-F19]|nr:hypothetical protein AYO44_03515 [Planctomycetaceae bacterium SCGC AG-212-F19]